MGARWSAEGSVDGMDPTYSEQADAFRRRIREFLDQNLPDGWSGIGALSIEEATAFTDDWRQKLAANSLLAPSWPKEYGGTGWTVTQNFIWESERAAHGVPDVVPFGLRMVGHVIYTYGNDEQKQRFLHPWH